MELLPGERQVRPAPIAFVRLLDERATVVEIHLDGAADLLPALRLDLRVEYALHLPHHRLHRRTPDELVVEFVNARLPPERDGAHHERRTELRLELVGRDGVPQRIEDVGPGAHANPHDALRLHVMRDHQSSHGIHRRMPEHAARVRLDRHPGPHDRVRVAELADDTVGIEALTVTEGLEKAPRRIEGVPASREASRGKLGRDHPVLRRPTHVQRLGHRPEVHANAGG